jgi:ribosome recycling factor
MTPLKNIYKSAQDKMDKTLVHLVHNFSTLRTGRANPAMVEGLEVEAYGTKQPIKALANIATPDAHTITIQPWDQSVTSAIERAIQAANLGMNPSSDGRLIRLMVPTMTGERRKEIVREAKKLTEEARVAARGIRHHAIDEIKKLEKEKAISEDEGKKAHKEIQDITDNHIKKIDEKLAQKEKEIMAV